jgi:hypothetical protein
VNQFLLLLRGPAFFYQSRADEQVVRTDLPAFTAHQGHTHGRTHADAVENGTSEQMKVTARASFIPFKIILFIAGMFRAAFTG